MGRRQANQLPRATTLRGSDSRSGVDRNIRLIRETQRERNKRAQTQISMLLALAADPDLHALASWLNAQSERDWSRGGRPRQHPDWCLLLFGACIGVFGSASSTARHLADPLLWRAVIDAAEPHRPADEAAPAFGPTRDQWSYFMRHRLTADVLPDFSIAIRNLAAQLACETGLLDPEKRSISRPTRTNVVGVDGKVFSSPLRTDLTERTDKKTGEIRLVRQDPARHLYGEAGKEGMAWGTKFAIASVRSALSGHRVVLGVEHVPPRGGGGEAGRFVDLMVELGTRASGISAFVADGAFRGKHIARVQNATGCPVVSPARRKSKERGGIVIGKYGHAAAQLPPSRTRTAWIEECGGHVLYAAGGTIYERVVTADGSLGFVEATRHQTKRGRKPDGGWAFYARHTLTCSSSDTEHDWWEPLTPTQTDEAHNFNRSDYLRVLPPTHPDYNRVYGMRADTESLNAQFERAFYNRRLPAWGLHNQTVIVLMAALAQNAWARHTWQRAIDRQQAPPQVAA